MPTEKISVNLFDQRYQRSIKTIQMQEEYKHKELTSSIIGCFYDVYNELGYGFLEKVYEKRFKIRIGEKRFYSSKTKTN